MTALTKLQFEYLQKIGMLLSTQLVLVFIVIIIVHKADPERICIFTCDFWVDIILFLLLAFMLIYLSRINENPAVRTLAFYGLGILMSFILALQYNIITMEARGNNKQVAKNFIMSVAIVIVITIAVVIALPFTMQYMNFIYVMGSVLTICLLGLIIWGFFVRKQFLIWVSISLAVFLGLLITDLTRLVYLCKKKGSVQCDAINGSTLLYVDLMNILQQIFILTSRNNN